ncbi:MAG: hypothetical protein K1X67_06515 [Fimbriimonadaceae bacterium]|nr:hypothetical protein [Fimbriimonadaceae bacterium]
MIPLVAMSVREQLRSQQQILRHWHLVPAEVTKVQNSGGENSQVTLFLSYQWNGRAHEATKAVRDSTPVDLKVPVWLLVNREKGKEYRILDGLTFVEVDPRGLSNSMNLNKLPHLDDADDPLAHEPS